LFVPISCYPAHEQVKKSLKIPKG